MSATELVAQQRTIIGKEVKKLRREGLVPAVVYGPGLDKAIAIEVSAREIERAYVQLGRSAMLRLKIGSSRARSVFIHQVQYDNTHRRLMHVDFLAPNMNVEMTVAVPVVLTGEAPAVRAHDGVLVQSANELLISALPDQIPGVLAVDVSGLTEIHAQITAGDVELPAGVTLAAAPDDVVVTVSQVQLAGEEEGETGEDAEAADAGSGKATGANDAADSEDKETRGE